MVAHSSPRDSTSADLYGLVQYDTTGTANSSLASLGHSSYNAQVLIPSQERRLRFRNDESELRGLRGIVLEWQCATPALRHGVCAFIRYDWGRALREGFAASTCPATVQVRRHLAVLQELAGLEPDWDSYGAARISGRALTAAGDLIADAANRLGDVVGERAAPYVVAPVADGGIFIEWRGPVSRLQVRVGGGAELQYLLVATDQDGQKTFVERNGVTRPQVLSALAIVLSQ